MTFDNALKVATAVSGAMASTSKGKRTTEGEYCTATAVKKRKRSTEGFRIINKKELILTYADTRVLLLKGMLL